MKFDRGVALVDRMVERDSGFSAEAMRLVHSVVADREHGRLRSAGQDVQCGDDAAQAYLPGADVEGAVTALFADLAHAAPALATPHLAAAFDQRLLSIHPFEDANGRTARLMTDWLLLRAGFPPVAGTEAEVTALFWQKQGRSLDRDAHLARITAGMQRTVDLLERV
jgi:Fic family protein